jgi:probable HAF family extracellular repeat protein
MKRLIVALSTLGLLAFAPVSPSIHAQTVSAPPSGTALHYAVVDLGTLGGNFTQGYGISATGHVGAGSTLPDGSFHAALWTPWDGLRDLGTLGGPNSVADTPNRQNEVPVFSELPGTDAYNENFCLFGTNHLCVGAVWKDGELRQLPTLGGNNAAAWAVNDYGVVAGFSETRRADQSCKNSVLSQQFRYKPVIWDPDGKIHRLALIPGDTVGFAFAINNRGQVVGASGQCSNTSVPPGPNAPHAVLWEPDGQPIDLGSLGGPGAEPNVADSINDRGEVVGGSMAKDGTVHTFLWTRTTGMMDIGAFPNAIVTVAGCCNTNNNVGQIVGFAIDGTTFNSTAFLWQNWTFTDLNTLIPQNSGWTLQNAASINDAGEITGYGLIDGQTHGFLLLPCDRAHTETSGCAGFATR